MDLERSNRLIFFVYRLSRICVIFKAENSLLDGKTLHAVSNVLKYRPGPTLLTFGDRT